MEIIDANTVFGVWPRKELDISINNLLKIMHENKVEKALSLSMKGVFYDYEEGNAETLKACREHPEIIPVATCDLRKYWGDKRFIKAIVENGFKALRLFPDLQNWPINYEPFEILCENLIPYRLPIIISVTGMGSITAISRICGPGEIPVILTGAGYGLFAEAIAVMKKYPGIYLETACMDTPDGFEIFVREVGATRLIFGSYSPINYFRPSFACLEKADLKDEEKSLIASGNIKKLLRI